MNLGKIITTASIRDKVASAGLINEGLYTLRIEAIYYGQSLDGNSKRVIVTFKVTGCEFGGCEIRNVFTIDNSSNPKAEEISRNIFANMLKSANITADEMTADFNTHLLPGRTVTAYVTIAQTNDEYPLCNKIKFFK